MTIDGAFDEATKGWTLLVNNKPRADGFQVFMEFSTLLPQSISRSIIMIRP